MTQRARRRGFTLIELLIVISVIAILALIVVPKLMGAARKGRESALKSNLQQLRNAIEQFQSDTGEYPDTLADLVAATEGDVDATVPTGSYKGPYLSTRGGIGGAGLPLNPFADPKSTTLTDHWNYDNATGEVTCPDAYSGSTMDGDVSYQDL
jgi:type II secretion system protein G